MSITCILFYSSVSIDNAQVTNTRRMEDLFCTLKFDFKKVDGADPEQKELRDKLFTASGLRGKYPLCLLENEDGTFTSIGTWDEVQSLAECESIPPEILEANPQIQTLSKVFVNVKKTA